MKISILTATHNRAKLLPNLYKSICDNAKYYDNIEWLIMNDGSTDNTEEVVAKWIKEKKVKIKYYFQENAGKMAALNNLIEHISGDIVIEIDDDDYFISDVFDDIVRDYKKIGNKDCYGILYLKKLIGVNTDNRFPLENQIVSLYNLYYKYDYKVFDAALTFKADIRKKFKHKLENSEKFASEARMYHEMDKKYKGLYLINREIMVCKYQDDGYSKSIIKLFKNNPYGFYEYFKELLSFDMKGVLFKKRLYMIKHYILFSTLTKKGYIESIKNVSGLFNKLLVLILYIPGKIATNIRIK